VLLAAAVVRVHSVNTKIHRQIGECKRGKSMNCPPGESDIDGAGVAEFKSFYQVELDSAADLFWVSSKIESFHEIPEAAPRPRVS
jgi:hypothetical protein